jgi:hypothetical protein
VVEQCESHCQELDQGKLYYSFKLAQNHTSLNTHIQTNKRPHSGTNKQTCAKTYAYTHTNTFIETQKLSLEVSICLKVVLIETLDLHSLDKRKSQQLQKACLDDREVSIEIDKSQFCLNTTFQSQKSRSRLRNLSRLEIVHTSQQFVSISIDCWDPQAS